MDQDEFEVFFELLNEHLREVQPIFDAFCVRHGFALVDRKTLGRYPRIRIERVSETRIWFDLSMGLDKDGHRFEQFRRDLPFELSGGAYVDVQDGSKHGTRLQKAILCFSEKPFDRVADVLQSEMETRLGILEQWDLQYLMKHGKRLHKD